MYLHSLFMSENLGKKAFFQYGQKKTVTNVSVRQDVASYMFKVIKRNINITEE